MDKLGVGIIGAGNISSAYLRLAPAFRALDLRAVADINMAAAKSQAEKFGVRASSVASLATRVFGSTSICETTEVNLPARVVV